MSDSKMVQKQCYSCSGTGVYVGWAEVFKGDDIGVQCLTCNGSGAHVTYASVVAEDPDYTGRLDREGIARVIIPQNRFIGLSMRDEEIVTYDEFKERIAAAEVLDQKAG